MLNIPGFSQHSTVTSLGKMVYYTADDAPWLSSQPEENNRPTLVFLHGFGGGSSAYEWSKVYPALEARVPYFSTGFNWLGTFNPSRKKLSY